jgi:indole-3-glycerol phosphate synthase
MGFLSDLVAEVRARLNREPLDAGRLLAVALGLPPARDLAGALRRAPTPAVIAEVKRASPSAGTIAEADAASQARAYEAGGAAAISVLTEPRHFAGSLADLRAVHLAVSVPVIRKDFLVHPDQVIEARAAGADAVLLITAALPRAELSAMLQTAADLGLGALVEVHTEAELGAALEAGAEVIGVNARDLETLEVDPERALELLARVPPDRIPLLESGISTRSQVERALGAGARAVLVGEALMRASDPVSAIRELRGAR